MDGCGTRSWVRTRLDLSSKRLHQVLERVSALLMSDGQKAQRFRLYHEVLRLDIVAMAGDTSQAYGLAWDQELSPVWRYPPPGGTPDLAIHDRDDHDGPGGILVSVGEGTPATRHSAYRVPRANAA